MRRSPLLALVACLASGCYQAVGAGYAYRFAEEGGHGVDVQWVIAMGEVLDEDEPVAFAKVSVAGGPEYVRAADAFGIMIQEDLGETAFFLRPGLDLLVIGVALEPDETWFGIGADLDAGFLVPLSDETGLEIGVHAGGDLSYMGVGSGTFVGAYLAFSWVTGAPELYTR